MGDEGQVENGYAKQGEVTVLRACLPVINADHGGMDPPVWIRQEARSHCALDNLVALWSLLDEHLAGKEKRIGGRVYQLALARRRLAANASGYVFETAGLQIKVELAMIRENEFAVPFALKPHMAVGLGVAGQPIEGDFIRGENVVLVLDPDFAGQRKNVSVLLLLIGSKDYGNTRRRCLNYFSNRVARGIGERPCGCLRTLRRPYAVGRKAGLRSTSGSGPGSLRGKLLGQRLRPKLRMTQH